MSLTLDIEGADVVVAHLASIGDASRKAAARALVMEAEAIMTKSKQEYVPVDTGVLRASGMVGEPHMEGDQIAVSLGFGGAAKDYAIVQHERLDFKHTVGQAKYLEIPLLEGAKGLAEKIGRAIREAWA